MAGRRRWFQFSLRTCFVILTGSALWLGGVVNRAREQREVTQAIVSMGGFVLYDWHFDAGPREVGPRGPVRLQRLFGAEFFQEIESVVFAQGRPHPTEGELITMLPRFQRMHRLKLLYLWPSTSEETRKAVRAALPACTVRFLGIAEHQPLIYRPGILPAIRPPGPTILSAVIDSARGELSKKR
jgi:hypothetical protein